VIRSAAIRLAAYLAVVYLTIGAYFYFRQSRLLFPAPRIFGKQTPGDSGLQFEDLRIPVNPGEYLHAWWIPAGTPSDKALLVFHGNGYVLEDMAGDEVAKTSRNRCEPLTGGLPRVWLQHANRSG
jgi:hypothetical protein